MTDWNPAAAMDSALALHRAGHLHAAREVYLRILHSQPDHGGATHMLGVLLHQLGATGEAESLLRRAAELSPDAAEVHCNLGVVLRARRKWDEAIACYQRALALWPNYAAAHQNLADVLNQTGDYVQAMAACQAALRLDPALPDAWNTLGNLHYRQGDDAAAEQHYRRALALRPAFAQAHFNLAVALLARGQYEEGWQEYQWREAFDPQRTKRLATIPRWRGEPLDGRTILLHADQGDGDTIQFARFVPEVQARGGRVLVECSAATARLLESIPGISVIAQGNDAVPPGVQLHCPLASLPGILGTTLPTIPRQVPYLRPHPEDRARWASRMSQTPAGLRVGLAWAGNPRHAKDPLRSIPFDLLTPLLQVPGVRFHSLQKHPPAVPLRIPPGVAWIDWQEALTDFSQTAGCISGLHLVITVDTAVAHVAGALGKRVWILLHEVPDWRWGRAGTACDWYPTARLYRQRHPGDWRPVIAEVALNLAKLQIVHTL